MFAAHAAGFDLAWRVPLLFAGLGLLAWRRTRPAAGVALVALLLLDLVPVSRPILSRGTGTAPSSSTQRAPQIAILGAAEPDARVLSLRALDASEYQTYTTSLSPEERSNDWIRWRAHAYGGEHGTPPRSWRGLDLLQSPEALRALGVTYVSTRSHSVVDTTGLVRVATGDDEIVYRFPNALGRAYAVPYVIAVANDSVAVARMLSPEFSPGRDAYSTDREAAGEYPGSGSLAVRWRRDEPDTLALDLRAPARAFVVVADTWFPGWTARLDGREVPIRRVNGGVRGIEVPAGDHALVMTFEPGGWAESLPITRAAMGSWALAAMAVAAGIARSRRRIIERAKARPARRRKRPR